jgi:carboxyl-terminal processing protease
MRHLIGALLVLLAACGQATVESATPTTAEPVTPMTRATITTAPPQELPVVIEDCTSPQVGFSPLCEVYELVQEWHMDRPFDPEVLAGAALKGLMAFSTEATEPPPRTLFCAIPDPAFSPLCEELAERVMSSAVPVDEAIEATVLAMGETGLDQFSYYVPPELVGSFRVNGVVGGIGVLLDATDAAGSKCVRITAACALEIVFVLEDNPGAEAGLEAGDRITEVNGTSVEGLGFVSTATRLAGNETGVVDISVERGGESIEFSIRRAPLVVPTVEIGVPRPGLGYIRIPDFESDVPGLVRDGLTELSKGQIDRLVVDLRDNPGGFIETAIDVATEFMTGGVVVETVGPGENNVYEAGHGGLATEYEIAVLVNAGTASAAEILATALRERRGAVIVGEPTFGKDAVQIAFELNNGGEFNVAIARWLSPNGTTVAGAGILPDFTIPLPPTMSTGELADLAFQGP